MKSALVDKKAYMLLDSPGSGGRLEVSVNDSHERPSVYQRDFLHIDYVTLHAESTMMAPCVPLIIFGLFSLTEGLISVSYHTTKIGSPPLGMSKEFVENPRQIVGEGMDQFRKGNVEKSIELFDRADALVSSGALRPYLWQRGISYYYADRFQEGSEQVFQR